MAELRFPPGRFTPYSLRRGGAIADFLRANDLLSIVFRGRWSDSRVARIYTSEGAALLAEMSMTNQQTAAIDKYVDVLAARVRALGRGKRRRNG